MKHCDCCREKMEEVMPSVYWCPKCHWMAYRMATLEATLMRLMEHVSICPHVRRRDNDTNHKD